MGLQIKNVTQLFNSLATWITADNRKLSDFTVGSALRTLTESISLQLEEFYFNMKQNVEYAIETAIYTAFGFELITQEKASGYIKIRFITALENSIVIPAGTKFSTSLMNSKIVYYETTDDYIVEKGAIEAIVDATCVEYGSIGNCEIGEITNLVTISAVIDTIVNSTRFTGGREEETKTERQERFKLYLKSLGRATRDSIAYGVKQVSDIAGVWVDDNYIGFVNVYCHDKDGNLPAELKVRVEQALDDYRAAGVEVKVLPVVERVVDLNVTLVVADGTEMDTYLPGIKTLIESYLNDYEVSDDFYKSDIITLVMSNYGELVITLDIEGNNVKTQKNELVLAGDVNVTYAYASDWR
jgi:uncharacterized phage protein gp47/JayE